MYQIENFFSPSIGPPGLSIFVEAGVTLVGGSGVTVPATTVSLPANSTSFVYLNISTAVIASTTSGFPATNCYPIATVVTGTTGVVSLVDNRPDVTALSGSAVGTVTSFSAGNIDAIATTSVATPTTTPALTFALSTQTANTVWAGPTTGAAVAPTFRALVAADLPAGTGTVTSFSAGNLSPLFTTSVATATTTPALSFALSNAAGGTVFGNPASTSGAPSYTTAPVLGIPGTSTGTIALASSTASGLFTVTAPANAATPTLTLPTTSNVLAGQLAGDGTVFATALNTASAAGTITLPTPQNQTANTFFAGPTTGAAAAPTFRALVAADIPSGTVVWNNIGNATGNLSLSNGTNTTTFNQTNNTAWLWYNTTTATVGTTNASPQIELAANYWTGAASAQDTWTVGSSLAAGANGTSTLTFSHSGSTAATAITISGTNTLNVSSIALVGQLRSTRAGVASSPALSFTGAPFTGGTGTTTFPLIYFNSGTAPTTFNTSGTVIGINAPSGFTGNLSDYRVNGSVSLYSVNSAGVLGNYNGIATVRNGVSANYASSDLTAQSAAIGATTLLSAPYTGAYEISWSADITTASDISSVLGGTNGFQVIYTSPTDSVVKTTVAGASVTSAANTTATATGGTITIFAKTGTNVQFQYGYTDSHTSTAMQYELHVTLRGL